MPENATTHPAQPTPVEGAVPFLLRLAKALHQYGTPAHRLEEAVSVCGDMLGVEVQVFSQPTSVFIAFGPMDDQQSFIMRVEPGEAHLERLARLDRLWNQVAEGSLSPRQGVDEIERVVNEPDPYNLPTTLFAFAAVSGLASRFFGAGWREMVASLIIGLLIGILGVLFRHNRSFMRLFEFLAGFLAAFLGIMLTLWLGKMSTITVMVGSLIILLPGLTLTVAIEELATRNLVAGTSRLMGALMIFASLGVGIALGTTLGHKIILSPSAESIPLAPWTLYVSILLATLCIGVLFRARPQDLWIISAAGMFAFVGGRVGAIVFGPELGACVGAMSIGVGSNLYARIADRPSTIPMLPGIIMLVPGSVGFMSFNSLLAHDLIEGVATTFSMFLIAAGLVAGLLLANVAVPSRKAL